MYGKLKPEKAYRIMEVALIVVVFVSFMTAAWAIYNRSAYNDQRFHDQAAINAKLNKLAHDECVDINQLRMVTVRALQSAVERARLALPSPGAAKSIAELRAEIALLKPEPCN